MPAKNATAPQLKLVTTGTKLPVKTFRLGAIKAAIWENESDQKKFYNVTFARTYRDDAKAYHDTASFGRDDLRVNVCARSASLATRGRSSRPKLAVSW